MVVRNMVPTKAIIEVLDTGKNYSVMFNPSEYNVAFSADISAPEPPSGPTGPSGGRRGEAPPQKDPFFDSIKVEDFSVKLIFDTYEKRGNFESGTDVRKTTKEIAELINPIPSSGNNKKRPPICLFTWGKFRYKGIITRVQENFILFLPDGTPVREELTLTFKAIYTKEELEKNMGLWACRKSWTVKSGDRLDIIAHIELKDASLWRKIARENHIDDPLNFPGKEDIGRKIIIPD